MLHVGKLSLRQYAPVFKHPSDVSDKDLTENNRTEIKPVGLFHTSHQQATSVEQPRRNLMSLEGRINRTACGDERQKIREEVERLINGKHSIWLSPDTK